MALGPITGGIVIALAVAVALLAVMLPDGQLVRFISHFSTGSVQQGSTECPLGFKGKNPHSWASTAQSSTKRTETQHSVAQQLPTVFYNGSIWTADVQKLEATAIAVSHDGTIMAVGSLAEVAAAVPQSGVMINLHRQFVMPGCVDAHVHLIGGGELLSQLDLRDVANRDAFVASVAHAVKGVAPGEWLLGGFWDNNMWGGELPSRHWIDEVTENVPVFLYRMDSHMALVNSAALTIAGIKTRGSAAQHDDDEDDDGVVRDDGGMATGLLIEGALGMVQRHIPAATAAQQQRAVHAAQTYLLQRGITAVHDMGRPAWQYTEEASWIDLQNVLIPMAGAGQLRMRVVANVAFSQWKTMEAWVLQNGREHASQKLFWGGVKEFSDGALGSRTALFHDPYHDGNDSTWRGMATFDWDRFRTMVRGIHNSPADLQMAVHAIGDAAVDNVAAILHQETITSNPNDNNDDNDNNNLAARHRIEHVQHINGANAAEQLRRAHVFAVVNPLHLLSDRRMLPLRLGRQRAAAQHAFAWRTMADARVRIAAASDWPVVDTHCMHSIFAAATRRQIDEHSDETWVPQEAMTMDEAMHAHTSTAAAAARIDHVVGSLKVGLKADFIVLSHNPYAVFNATCAGNGSSGQSMTSVSLPEVKQVFVGGRCEHGCANAELSTPQ